MASIELTDESKRLLRMPYEVAASLADSWEAIARNKFRDAEVERDPMGKRLIEHGAMCYFNCAQALREAMLAKTSLLKSDAASREAYYRTSIEAP